MRKRRRSGVGVAWRVREFRALVAAEVLSVAGDQIARVALALLVYGRTGSASLTGLTYALTFLPYLFGGWLLSGLADRFRRREVMVVTDLVRAGLAVVVAVPGMPIGVLWTAVALLTMAGAPFKAAQQALLPIVLGERYEQGLAVRTMSTQTAQLAGFAAGGMLVAALTPTGAMLINAATFVVAAVLVRSGVRSRPVPTAPAATGASTDMGAAGRARGGLWAPFALVSVLGLFVVGEGVAAPYAHAVGAGAWAVAVLMAADPVGAIIGSWLESRLPAIGGLGGLGGAVLAAVLAGLSLMACLVWPGVLGAAVLWVCAGMASAVYMIRAQSALVARVPDHRRGRVMGWYTTCLYASQGLAMLGGGVVAEWASPVWAVAAGGGLGVVLVGMVGVGLWVQGRHRRRGNGDDDNTDSADQVSLDMASSRAVGSPGGSEPPEPPAGTGSQASMPDTQRGRHGRSRRRTDHSGLRGWALWTRPQAAVRLLLAVETTAVVLVVAGAGLQHWSWSRTDLTRCGLLILLGVLAAEITRRIERMRRRATAAAMPHINISSVWTLAAGLLLPISLAALVAVAVYTHLWWRSWRRLPEVRPHQTIYNCANVIVCIGLVRLVVNAAPTQSLAEAATLSSMGWLLAAVAVFFAANLLLAAASTVFYRPGEPLTVTDLAGDLSENILEAATLFIGAVVTYLVVTRPWMVVLLYVPLYVMHRSVMVKQLEDMASIDPQTNLYNVTTWTTYAHREIDRARRNGQTCGLLFIDLDGFKKINNRYGRQVGDNTLRAVGATLKAETRGPDLCGRWSGDQLVVLLADITTDDVEAAAVRLRGRLAEAPIGSPTQVTNTGTKPRSRPTLSVSIGAAVWPEHGDTLDEVLITADNALFAAKDAGRGQVRVAGRSTRPTSTTPSGVEGNPPTPGPTRPAA